MAEIVARSTKSPAGVIDVAITWELEAGDSISSAEWSVSGGIELGTGAQAPIVSGLATVAWVRGGSSGDHGIAVCKVTTAQGRIGEAGVRIDVRALS